MHLFGRSKKKPEPPKPAAPKAKSLPDAIVNNKEAILTLEKRQTFIERKIELQIADAKEKARNKDKRGALMALKRKKMLNAELEQLQNARLTLEQQIMSLESTQTQQVAVGALSTGVQAQKQMQAQLDIDKVEDLMDDIKEQQDMQQEIAQVIGGNNDIMDEDDLLEELEEMEALELDMALGQTNTTVPSQPLPETAAPQAKAPASGYSERQPVAAGSDGLNADEAAQLADLQALLS